MPQAVFIYFSSNNNLTTQSIESLTLFSRIIMLGLNNPFHARARVCAYIINSLVPLAYFIG
jgi:hypothetical protein